MGGVTIRAANLSTSRRRKESVRVFNMSATGNSNHQHRSLDTHTSDGQRQFAAAADRNKEAILDVLNSRLHPSQAVTPCTLLEVASGSGQHAAHMAPHFPWLQWQPTERSQDCFDSIHAWRKGISNIMEPKYLDASAPPEVWPAEKASCIAILCVNMTHISPWEATCGLIAGAGHVLATGGKLFLYGPFMLDGRPTTESNADFDTTLRTKNSDWGLRDVADIDSLGSKVSLKREEIIEMPANNFTLVYMKHETWHSMA